MAAGNFVPSLAFTLGQEGGWSDNPADPGGCTNQGVTLAAYRAELGNPDLTCDDLRGMTDEQRDHIYLGYWDAVRADELASGVDLMTFDFGVNAGPATAVQLLQRQLGIFVDGIVGPVTIARVNFALSQGAPQFLQRLADRRLEYYANLDRPEFIDGWAKRATACAAAAVALLP